MTAMTAPGKSSTNPCSKKSNRFCRRIRGWGGRVDEKKPPRVADLNSQQEGKMKRELSVSTLSATSTAASSCSSLSNPGNMGESESSVQGSTVRQKSAVSFGSVEIREYPRVLSDNPSVSNGPPIGIGWSRKSQHQATYVIAVDDYEEHRPKPRSQTELLVPRQQRETWLREWGYSRKQMEEVVKEVGKVKANRAQTAKMKRVVEKMQEGVQSANRKFKRLTGAMESDGVLYQKESEARNTDTTKGVDRDSEGSEQDEGADQNDVYSTETRPE